MQRFTASRSTPRRRQIPNRASGIWEFLGLRRRTPGEFLESQAKARTKLELGSWRLTLHAPRHYCLRWTGDWEPTGCAAAKRRMSRRGPLPNTQILRHRAWRVSRRWTPFCANIESPSECADVHRSRPDGLIRIAIAAFSTNGTHRLIAGPAWYLAAGRSTVTAARRGGLSRVAIWVQVAPHDEGDGSEVGRARRGVAGEWAFGGRFRDGQGVSGVNAALGSIAAVRAGLRRGGGSYGERGKAAIQGSVSSPAAGGREDATVPAGARRWGRAGVGRDCHRDRTGTCPGGSRVRWVAAR